MTTEPQKVPEDERLKWVIVGVSSMALMVSLLATIFGKVADFREVSLIFSAVSAFVFGAHIFNQR